MTNVFPVSGETYTDAEGRTLLINVVDPANTLGRQIQGEVTPAGADPDRTWAYSCTFPIWERTWRDATPTLPPSEMRGA